MRNSITKISSLSFVVVLAGCATPEHTNTLVFGTTTKFALDVSVTPTGAPDFTLGYKRHEGVWMPLLANSKTGDDSVPAECDKEKSDCLFQGKDENGKKVDTYSVLASFGAKFGGGSTVEGDAAGANVQASGGLAQFFATGIAAQKLAQEGNSRLVAVQPTDQDQLSEAKDRAAIAEVKAEDANSKLVALLGEKTYSEAKAEGVEASTLLVARKKLVLASVAPMKKLDKSKWETAISKTSLNEAMKNELKKQPDYDSVNSRLNNDAAMSGSLINALYEAVK